MPPIPTHTISKPTRYPQHGHYSHTAYSSATRFHIHGHILHISTHIPQLCILMPMFTIIFQLLFAFLFAIPPKCDPPHKTQDFEIKPSTRNTTPQNQRQYNNIRSPLQTHSNTHNKQHNPQTSNKYATFRTPYEI